MRDFDDRFVNRPPQSKSFFIYTSTKNGKIDSIVGRLVNKRTFIFNYFDEILSFEINIAPLFFNVSTTRTKHAHCQSSYNVLISIKVHLYAETYAYSKRTLHSIFSRQTRKRTVHRTRIPSYSTSIFALPFPLLIARLTYSNRTIEITRCTRTWHVRFGCRA